MSKRILDTNGGEGARENFIRRSFMFCTLHEILL
jgi:hypothetical protein